MKVTLKEFLSFLDISQDLPEYQSVTYQYRDPENGHSCSAEVYMGGEQAFVEVEVQKFTDDADKLTPSIEQVMSMKAKPKLGEKWSPYDLTVKGEATSFGGWEEGACAFFTSVCIALKNGMMPDIDALIDEHLAGEGGFAGRSKRGGGRKNPKFKPPSNIMNMKQGM